MVRENVEVSNIVSGGSMVKYEKFIGSKTNRLIDLIEIGCAADKLHRKLNYLNKESLTPDE